MRSKVISREVTSYFFFPNIHLAFFFFLDPCPIRNMCYESYTESSKEMGKKKKRKAVMQITN
ncbi:Uncharacterized protein APZ42_011704 [Daphnia magna]|uniref:Uncharacterized protein n=1 Tax=Daphnia magna TaxID=35525 RepID=A0A162SWG8_9CRUS|nr:Uncharacterized protein APZ42_011704 [Daphnia magna]